ncbi:MAG: pyridoxal phosphate-dependent aminotransferase [candidate division Zixibacteria bacterium]|nr:pyridoxal phosphate-dependent aminotransferase [candidate division Zixibacteria bacterium]
MDLAKRMSRLGTESAFEVLARAQKLEKDTGMEVVHLQIGEPDFATPANIREAAKKALDDGHTHYSPSPGILEVREAICTNHFNHQGVQYTPEQVVITPGSKLIMFALIMMLGEPGVEIIYPDPGYPIYKSVIDFSGATAVPIPLRESNDFRLDIDELEKLITSKTKLIVINTPQNPTGGVFTKEDVEKIYKLACEKDVYILTDEVYSRIIYDMKMVSISQFDTKQDRVIVLDGLSKVYAACGWRIGWGLIPKHLAPSIARMQTNISSCATSFAQMAVIEALLGDQSGADAMKVEFEKRRDFFVKGLNEIEGFSCFKPGGAFYVWPNIKKTGWDSRDLAEHLLVKLGIAGLSGTAFGNEGQGYLRFSYANSIENIEKALTRMKEAMPALIKK